MNKKSNQLIYEKIDEILKERHMSRRKLAIEAGISPSTFQTAFSRKSQMSFETLKKILNVLEISMEDFANATIIPAAKEAGIEVRKSFSASLFLKKLGYRTTPTHESEKIVEDWENAYKIALENNGEMPPMPNNIPKYNTLLFDDREKKVYKVRDKDITELEKSIVSFAEYQVSQLIAKSSIAKDEEYE